MVANACKKPQRNQYHIQVALPPFHGDLDFKRERKFGRMEYWCCLTALPPLELFSERAICV